MADGLKNTIRWNESAGVPKSDSTTTTVTKNWVQKSAAWADKSTGLINWTVTINDNYPLDMYGITIADVVADGHLIEGNIKLTGGGGVVIATDIAPNADKNGFSYTINSHTAQKYTFTYQTRVKDGLLTAPGKHTFKNTAGFESWGKEYYKDASIDITNGVGVGMLSKAVGGIDPVDYTAEWTINITGNTAAIPTKLVDEVEPHTNTAAGMESWILKETLAVTYADGTALADGAYSVSWTHYTATGHNNRAYRLTITFVEEKLDLEKGIKVSYKSAHAGEKVIDATKKYNNKAVLTYTYGNTSFTANADDNWTLDTRGPLAKSAGAFRRLASGDYVIDWEVVVNRDNDSDGKGDRDYTGTVTVVDTLPAGLTYLAGSASASYKQGGSTSTVAPGATVSGSAVTFALPDVGRNIVTLTYSTVVDADLLITNDTLNFKNEAELKVDGAIVARKSATKSVQPEAIKKTGSQTGFLVDYKIVVNKLAVNLDADSASLVLTDTLQDYMLLSTGNVRVRDGNTNAVITEGVSISYNGETRLLRVVVPDERYLIIEYSVQLLGKKGATINVTNTAQLSGTGSLASTYTYGFQVLESEASITVEPNSIRLTKIDADDIGRTLAGAEFTLWKIDRVTGAKVQPGEMKATGANGVVQFDGLDYDQLYVIEETKAPAGYAPGFAPRYFAIPGSDETAWDEFVGDIGEVFDGTFAVGGGQHQVTNTVTHVSISKVTITGGDELPGATLKVMDGDEVIEEWISGDEPHEIIAKLIAGKTYTLVEETAPNGYVIAESIEFTVSEDGTVDTVEMVDAPTHVTISKVAVTGGDELPGATLKVMDGDEVIEEWISGDEPHEIIAKLIAGKTYTLVEETAPNGYVVAESIEFTVSEDGTVDTVEMVDAPTHVSISKVAVTGGDELPGATLKVMDGDEVIEEWISGDKPHEIIAKLIAGKTYTLVEETAPNGYVVAESIEFTVSEDGTVDTVEMVDAPTHVTISKVAVTGGDELPGATLKVMDGDEVIEEWISGDEPHEIIAKLIAGKTYTLVEETAPNGYVVAESIEFTVSEDGTVDTVEMVDAPTHVTISKVAVTGGDELPGATLKVMDGDEVIEEWISGDEPHEIIAKLIAGKTYTLVEETAPNGYVVAESIKFTVSKDGSIDRVEMVDAPTDVTISKRRITGDDELPGATLKLVDAQGNLVETWVSGDAPHRIVAKLTAGASYTLIEESAPKGYKIAESITFTVNTDGTPQTVIMRDAADESELPKTGDDTNLILWLAILGGSIALLIVAIALLRRRKNA